MKYCIISIHPQWVEKIFSGEKTIEVRKSVPACLLPKLKNGFKTEDVTFLVYCTFAKKKEDALRFRSGTLRLSNSSEDGIAVNGKLVGEFICHKANVYGYDEHIGYPTPKYEGDPSFHDCGDGYWITGKDLNQACLTYDELTSYGNKETLYGLEISDPVLYEDPKFLLEKAPQSWCYVKEERYDNL